MVYTVENNPDVHCTMYIVDGSYRLQNTSNAHILAHSILNVPSRAREPNLVENT